MTIFPALAADLDVEEALELVIVLHLDAFQGHELDVEVQGLAGEGVVAVQSALGVGDLGKRASSLPTMSFEPMTVYSSPTASITSCLGTFMTFAGLISP